MPRCSKNCDNNPNKETTISLLTTINLNADEMKSCGFCKHYFCLINQGIWGCAKNHTVMNASKCEDYAGTPPVYKLTSTKPYRKQERFVGGEGWTYEKS